MFYFTTDFREVMFSSTCHKLSSQLHISTILKDKVHKAYSYLPFKVEIIIAFNTFQAVSEFLHFTELNQFYN